MAESSDDSDCCIIAKKPKLESDGGSSRQLKITHMFSSTSKNKFQGATDGTLTAVLFYTSPIVVLLLQMLLM